MKEKNMKDISVEIARVIGCAMVISLHLSLDAVSNNNVFFGRQFINSLVSDGSTVFWLISGFFLNDGDYFKRIKKNFLRLLLPTWILSIVSYLAYDYYLIKSGTDLYVKSFYEYCRILLCGAFSFRNFAPSSSHYWFIYIYFFIILIYPVIRKISLYINNGKKSQMFFCIAVILLFGVNDLNANFLKFSTHYFGALFPACLEILFGSVVYKYKNNKLVKETNIIVFLSMYLLVNYLRSLLYCFLVSNGKECFIMNWFSLFSLVSASFVMVISFKLGEKIKNRNLIEFLSSETLYIYMIHPYIIKVFKKTNIYSFVFDQMHVNDSIIIELLYIFIFQAIVYLTSGFVCFSIKYLFVYAGRLRKLMYNKKQ